MNTLIVFLVSMVFLLVVLIRFKWSASVGLVSATIMMGLLSGMKIAELTGAISGGFGSTMTSTGLVIIFGCIFGEMLGSSGALEEIAKFLLRKVGSKHDYLAINLLGYVVSIPVYFGSAYVMLSPLLNSLQKLTNKKMTGYVNALFVGLLLTHCIVAPTPGPVAGAAEGSEAGAPQAARPSTSAAHSRMESSFFIFIISFKFKLSESAVFQSHGGLAEGLYELNDDHDYGAHGEHDGVVISRVAVVDGDGAESAASGDAGHGGVAEDGGSGDGRSG